MAQPSVNLSVQADEKQLAGSVTRAIDSGVRNSQLGSGKATKQLETGFKSLTDNVKGFDRELDRANRRVLSFGAAATLVYGTVRAFRELVSAGIEVEKSLTAINSIIKLSSRDLDRFGKDLFDVARQTGQSFRETAAAALEFSRQGLGAAETAKRTRDAMILVRLTGIDATKAVQGLTAALNTFNNVGVDSTDILNKLVAADDAFAVSAGGLIEAFTRVGSVVTDAGASIDEFIGLVTAARQITGRSEAVIGNSLKTIFTRLERSTTLDQLEELGVRVRNASGEARNAYDILKDLGRGYDTLTKSQQQYVAELSAGVFQINQFKAIVGDLGKTNGITAAATETAAKATNNALVRNAALNDTLSTSIQNLKTSATEAANVVGQLSLAPALNTVLSGGSFVANLFGNIKATGDTKPGEDAGAYIGESILKGIGNVLLGPGLILLTKAFAGTFARTVIDGINDFRGAVGIFNNALPFGGKQQESTLTTVNNLLSQATQQEQRRFQAAKTVADQEAIILGILERQYAVQARMTGGGAPIGLRGGAARPRAAEGYIPMAEEAAAIGAGVGGAPRSARPVYLPSFNRGNGQRGIVANTSEWMVPGAAGGAIYNRDMIQKYGLPPGSKPVAAGGYIPNAAFGSFLNPTPYGYPYQYPGGGSFPGPYKGGITPASSPAPVAGGQGFGQYLDPVAGSSGLREAERLKAQQEAARRAMVESLKRMEDYEKAKKEILTKETDTQARLNELERQKQRDLQAGFALIEKERAQLKVKTGLTDAEIRDADKALAATQKLYADARKRGATLPLNLTFQGQSALPYGPSLPPTYAANQAIAGYGSIIPYGPPTPSAALLSVRNASIYNDTRVGNPANGTSQQIISRGKDLSASKGYYSTNRIDIANGLIDPATGLPSAAEQARINRDIENDKRRYRVKQELAEATAAQTRATRMGRRATGVQLATLAGSFAAGFIPEGQGGTGRGQALGALSYGLQGSAIGAGLGSLGGPLGTIIGALVGGLGSAIVGFLNKSEKSFDELAKEVTDTNTRIKGQIDAAAQVFQLDDQEVALKENGASPRAIQRIQTLRSRAIAGVTNAEAQKILQNRATNPNAREEIQAILGGQASNAADEGGLLLASNLVRGGVFGGSLTKEQRALAAQGIGPLLANLSDDDIKKLRSDVATNPLQALQGLLGRGGVSASIQNDILNDLSPLRDETTKIFAGQGTFEVKTGRQFRAPLTADRSQRLQDILNDAIGGIEASGARQTIATKPIPTITARNIRDAIGALNREATLGGISPDATLRINQIAQRTRLARPDLSDLEKIALEGQFGIENIQAQYSINAARTLVSGKAGIIGNLRGSGVTDPAALQAITRATNRAQLQALLEPGGLPGVSPEGGDALKQSIKDLILQMEALEASQAEDINVTKGNTDILTTAYRETLTLEGARREDAGALKRAMEALKAAQDRQEDPAVIAERIGEVQAAAIKQALRENPRNRPQADAQLLAIQLSQDVDTRRRRNASIINLGRQGSDLVSGDALESALSDEAKLAGQRGNSIESLKGGFGSRFAGLKQDIRDLSQLGSQLASSLENNLGNAFGDFITGAQKGKDAFKSFTISILNDAARAVASKAVSSLLAMAITSFMGGPAIGATSTAATPTFAYPSGGQASGGIIHRAAGGDIPAMVMKGEMIFGPAQAKRIGYGNLASINSGAYQKRAGGGPMYVGAGSGYQDDVRLNLAAGSFVVRKAMVDRYGAGYLSKLAGGGMPTAVSINNSLTDMAQPSQSLVRGYSTGGGNASATAYPAGAGWGSGGAVSISNSVTINDQRTTSQTETSTEGMGVNRQLGTQISRAVDQAVMRVLQDQRRVGGTLRIESLRNST